MSMYQTDRFNKLGVAVLTTFRDSNAQNLLRLVDANEKAVFKNNVGLEFGQHRTSSDGIFEVPGDTIAVLRNAALSELIARGCTDIILLEDDVQILQPNACSTYAEALRQRGIGHAMLGKCFAGEKPIAVYEDLAFYTKCHGAVTYFTARAIEQCGLCDERFQNALDHVEMTYRLAKAGFTSPFGTYCDVVGSEMLFKHNDNGKSSIKHDVLYCRRYDAAFELFKKKHGIAVKDVNKPCKEALEDWIRNLSLSK